MAKVMFSCSIRGSHSNLSQRELAEIAKIVESLGHELVSKQQVNPNFEKLEAKLSNVSIHDRDYGWIHECDCVIAEISNPSLGVGAEISDAAHLGKPVLCIFKHGLEKKVSAYVCGMAGSKYSPTIKCESYSTIKELKSKLGTFLKNL